MARKQYVIGHEGFSSKKELRDRIRHILRQHVPGSIVIQQDDATLLEFLFVRHPDFGAKVNGRAISHFKVDLRNYGSKCFYVVFEDGTWDHFSYVKCL